jgi:hypothetical protein
MTDLRYLLYHLAVSEERGVDCCIGYIVLASGDYL